MVVLNILIKNENPNICGTGGWRVKWFSLSSYRILRTLYIFSFSKLLGVRKRSFGIQTKNVRWKNTKYSQECLKLLAELNDNLTNFVIGLQKVKRTMWKNLRTSYDRLRMFVRNFRGDVFLRRSLTCPRPCHKLVRTRDCLEKPARNLPQIVFLVP